MYNVIMIIMDDMIDLIHVTKNIFLIWLNMIYGST